MTDFKACPACGAGLKEHKPETDLCYETWRFYCDGVVMKLESGKLTAEDPCENALRFALRAGDVGTPELVHDDRRECAFIRLRGATERLLMILQYRSDHNYALAMEVVEGAMAEYRDVVGGPARG